MRLSFEVKRRHALSLHVIRVFMAHTQPARPFLFSFSVSSLFFASNGSSKIDEYDILVQRERTSNKHKNARRAILYREIQRGSKKKREGKEKSKEQKGKET